VVAPWFLKLIKRFPVLRRIPARLIGLGVRPEHVKSPEILGSVQSMAGLRKLGRRQD